MDFWIDWEGIPPTVDWWREIEKGIETADIFLFLLSPDSVGSKVCGQEIEHAVKNGKRLVPVVVRNVPASEAPAPLRVLNWIYLREEDHFRAAFSKLMRAINTDYAWVQSHRELQVKALEWQRSRYRNDLLLRGEELQAAEAGLSVNASKEPHPTDLQRDYVLKSRQASDRQRRITTGIALAVMVSLAALALYAVVQAGIARDAEAEAVANAAIALTNESEAKRQARIATSRLLAANSILNRDKSQLSVLFAVEALEEAADLPRAERLQPEQALRDALGQIGGIPLQVEKGGANLNAFSPDGRWLAIWASGTPVQLTDLQNASAEPFVLQGYEGRVLELAFSPDGRWLAITCDDGTARLWDTLDLTAEPRLLQGYPDFTGELSFSPYGRWLVTLATYETTLNLWDLQNPGPALQVSNGEGETIVGLAFSPDGHWMVTGSGASHTVRLWNLQKLSDAAVVLQGPVPSYEFDDVLFSVQISPDNRWLLAVSADRGALLWELQDLQAPPVALSYVSSNDFDTFLFTTDGHWLVGDTSDIRLWDLQNPAADPIVLNRLTKPVRVSGDGHWLAANAGDNTVQLIDLQNIDAEPVILRGHTGFIRAMAVSPDNRWLATGSTDRTVRLWDVRSIMSADPDIPAIPLLNPIVLKGHEGRESGIGDVDFSPDGLWLLSMSTDGMPRLWEMQRLSSEPLTWPYAQVFAFSHNGQWFATEDLEHAIRIFDLQNGSTAPLILRAHERRVNALLFSPDDRWLATESYNNVGSVENTMYLWDLKNPAVPPTSFGEGPPFLRLVQFSPDSHWLVTSALQTVELWELNQMEAPVTRIDAGSGIFIKGIAFSADSRWLAIGSEAGVQLLDLQNPSKDPISLGDHESRLVSLAMSPDGRWLATKTFEGVLRLWDIQELRADPMVRPGASSTLDVLTFSPDSRWLTTNSLDQTVRVWDMQNLPAQPVALDGYSVYASSSTHLVFSPDSRWLAMAGSGVVPARLWDLQDPGKAPLLLYGPEEPPTYAPGGGVVFSRTGAWLATWNGTRVSLWAMQNLSPGPMLLKGHQNDVQYAEFSSDEEWLATRSLEQTRLWQLDLSSIKEKACQVVGRNFSREEWALYFADEPYRQTCQQWPAEPEATPAPSAVP